MIFLYELIEQLYGVVSIMSSSSLHKRCCTVVDYCIQESQQELQLVVAKVKIKILQAHFLFPDHSGGSLGGI
jgi:hypothetical protein